MPEAAIRSPAARLFWNEIGNLNDDLDCISGLSGPDAGRKMGSFLQRNFRNVLVRVHSLVQNFLRSSVHELLKNRPAQVLLPGEKIEITLAQVMSAPNLETLQADVTGELFRRMENAFKKRSGLDLAEKIVKALNKKKLSGWEQTRDSAEPYFALRHLIVHSQSKFDAQFVADFGSQQSAPWGSPVENGIIPGKALLVRAAIPKFGAVVDFVDKLQT